MRKIFLPLLFLVGSVPALAQWQPVGNPVPINTRLFNAQLDPIDAQTAWFVNSTLFVAPPSIQISRTIDGGQTWQNISPAAPAVGRYRFGVLEAFDAQHSWVIIEHTTGAGTGVTDALELHYTSNWGSTWTLRPLPTPTTQLGQLRFFSLTEGILVNPATGTLHRTTDGGLTWQLQSTMPVLPTGQRLGQLREISGMIWTTIYNEFRTPVGFWASTDRGFTWRTQALPVISGYSEVVFRDVQHALLPAPGLVNAMLSSTDGGLTWQNATPPPFSPLPIGTLTAIPGTRTYIAGYRYYGPIQALGSGAAVTYDDGQTWTSLGSSSNGYLTIQFTAPDAGWYVRAYIEPAVEDTWYDGTGRYVGSPLATRATSAQVITADIFPNPSASGVFTVRLPATAGPVSAVRVLDALGRVVYQAASLSANQRLDLSRQPKGVYSLEMQTSSGVVRRKLLVQ